MYSRPSAFGPPLGIQISTTSSFSGSVHDFGARNGIYASHTPPYYDGESWIDLIYYPQGLESKSDNATSHYFEYRTGENALSPYQPTLGEIFTSPDESVFESSASGVPLVGTFVRKWRFDQEELLRDSNSTYHKTIASTYGPAAGPWVNGWSMQGDASLNIFDTTTSDDEKKWRIQTKFETPMLNFNDVSVANGTLTVSSVAGANSTIPRGMWHQFGRLPLEDEGVYMQVSDIPADWLSAHPSASLKPDMAGFFAQARSQNESSQKLIEVLIITDTPFQLGSL